MIGAVFALLFAVTVSTAGIVVASGVWLTAFVVTAVVVFGAYMAAS